MPVQPCEKFPYGDTRFSPGYTWVSEEPLCRSGLCMPSTDHATAAAMYCDRPSTRYWHMKGRTWTVWTMQTPTDTPQMHVISLPVDPALLTPEGTPR
jgi:hypothetical protein